MRRRLSPNGPPEPIPATHPTASPTMAQPIPTVADVLARTHLGGHYHEWGADGGAIRVTRAELRQALEDAYDPLMPNWPAIMEIGNG